MSESVLMRINGHKTRSVFERYSIVSEDDLTQAIGVIEEGQRVSQCDHWLSWRAQQDSPLCLWSSLP